ncbi:hypothetical protein ACN20G_01840 [Streptomyces sp. BI20]|uniref:hypothetical protein n=1 Tax=Streptomyces sp. BI20 TaxID=3403460 RepID=UPI003C78D63A
MLEQVLGFLGPRALERWLALALQPMVFLLCCAGLVLWTDGDLDRVRAVTAWSEKAGAPLVVLLAVAGVLLLAGAGLLALALATPLLRFLTGTGPLWRIGGEALAAGAARRAGQADTDWQRAMGAVRARNAPRSALAHYQRCERERRRRPVDPLYVVPTRLGNQIRAAERRIADRYGLDSVVVWPVFASVLPEPVLLAAERARAALDQATAALLWGLVFAAGMWPFTWWAIPAGLLVAPLVVYGVLPARARRFGEATEAAFAVHRAELYRALRLPAPASPADEPRAGRELTSYLVRGSDDPAFRFLP